MPKSFSSSFASASTSARPAAPLAPALAEERQESCKTLRKKREALRQRRISHERHCLAGADRERALRGGGAARQQEDRATLAALERVEKARKELDEASRELRAEPAEQQHRLAVTR